MYELGKIAYSPQIFTSPRKHRLLVRGLIWQWGSNICGLLVGYTNQRVEDDPYLPSQVLRQFSGPHPPPMVTLPLSDVVWGSTPDALSLVLDVVRGMLFERCRAGESTPVAMAKFGVVEGVSKRDWTTR